MRRHRRKCTLCFLALFLSVSMFFAGVARPVPIKAHVFDNAVSYYNENRGGVKFWKVNQKDGEICYATRAKAASTQVRFTTLGWKVSVDRVGGEHLQTIYFKLGGSYMRSVDSRSEDGYEYNLYALMLSSLKKRMNAKANKALQEGSCTMILDACMAVSDHGTVRGSMDDGGNFKGKVYTSYKGIAGAAAWSEEAKNSLHSYFDKEVVDLFYDVKLKKSKGIASVSGEGHYLYGTHLTVSAKVKKGYTFAGWKGMNASDRIDCSFYVNESGTMTAKAKAVMIRIFYHRNYSQSDTLLVMQTVNYGDKDVRMRKENWEKDGKKPIGYALSQGAAEANYTMDAKITDTWILKYAPQVHLYAVWPGEEVAGMPESSTGEDPALVPEEELEPDPEEEPDTEEEPDPEEEPDIEPDPKEEPEPEEEPDPEEEPLPVHIPAPDPPPDDSLPPVAPISMRFISKKYFEDSAGRLVPRGQGGLDASSRWALDLSLRSLLRTVLSMVEP